jgi:FKBP-type peptidyl-prolyl cis-trans isomerase
VLTRTECNHTAARGGSAHSRLVLIALAAALAAVALLGTACSQATTTAPQSAAPAGSQPAASTTTSEAAAAPAPSPAPAQLDIKDTKVGKGKAAKVGDTVTVDYTGWLTDGTKFDSSIDRKQPFQFKVGAGDVIEGWDKGVPGMKVGGTRVLIIPGSMGYGEQGSPPVIPPNATLKFEIKLLSIDSSQ